MLKKRVHKLLFCRDKSVIQIFTMDPNQIFNDVIYFVENSQLNFCINRRKINKKFFDKRLNTNSDATTENLLETKPLVTMDTQMDTLKEENHRLREVLNIAEDLHNELKKNKKDKMSQTFFYCNPQPQVNSHYILTPPPTPSPCSPQLDEPLQPS